MGNMVEAAAELWSEVERAATRFKDLSDADVLCDRGPGSWVKKEILGHLIDSAANNHQRFVRAQFADPFIWPGYDQRAWVLVQRYRERPWLDLVELWATLNQKMVEYLDSVSLKDLVEQQRARQPGVLRDMREDGGARQPAPAARTQPSAAEKADKPARPKMVNSVFSLAQS